jgi:protein TonB
MKAQVVSKLAILLSLGGLAPFAASAKTPEQAYIEASRKGSGIPVPLVVVAPRVDAVYAGQTVTLEFTVDATGKATEITVESSPDEALSTAVVDAVKQWEFAPAQVKGAPVATKVELPVQIVDNVSGGTVYASN